MCTKVDFCNAIIIIIIIIIIITFILEKEIGLMSHKYIESN